MAMYDWNQNGKSDMGDSFINYQVFKDTSDNGDNYYGKGKSSGNGIWIFMLFIVIVSLICKPLGVLILLAYTWVKLLS